MGACCQKQKTLNNLVKLLTSENTKLKERITDMEKEIDFMKKNTICQVCKLPPTMDHSIDIKSKSSIKSKIDYPEGPECNQMDELPECKIRPNKKNECRIKIHDKNLENEKKNNDAEWEIV